MPPDKKLDGEHEVPEFVWHAHVVDTELRTDFNLDVLKRLLWDFLFVTEPEDTFQRQALSLLYWKDHAL